MKMADVVLPLGFGLLFGLGLVVSGMTDIANVVGFLDIAGDWRPALALVMGSAIAVALPLFQWTRRRGKAFDGTEPESPPVRIDRRLIIGAAVFGVGWGLSGICTGPGVVWLSLGIGQVWPFLLAVAAGAWLADRLPQARNGH